MTDAKTTHRVTEAPSYIRDCSRCLGASVARFATVIGTVVAFAPMWQGPVSGQQLLDRVVARVAGTAITQTDVDAAVALGLVTVPAAQDPAAARRLVIERQLVLTEVVRFPPAEPSEEAVAARVAQLKAHAGAGYEALLRRTGLDEQRLRELARESLRIEAYIEQRFGAAQSPERRREMVAQWIDGLRMRGEVVEVTARP